MKNNTIVGANTTIQIIESFPYITKSEQLVPETQFTNSI